MTSSAAEVAAVKATSCSIVAQKSSVLANGVKHVDIQQACDVMPVTVTDTVTVTKTLTASSSAAPTTTRPTSPPSTTTPTSPPPTSGPPKSGFPDATTTGPTGSLAAYTGPDTITAANTTIQNVEIDQCIDLAKSASNTTFRNVRFKARGCYWLLLNDSGATNLQVVNSEFDGLGDTSNDAAIAGSNYSLTGVDIHGTTDGMKLGDNVTVRDSYIHDMAITGDSHNDGMQSLGSVNVKILHNTIILKDGSTSAMILSTGSADQIRNLQFDGNLVGGGAYTIYGGYQRGTDDASKVSGISITNNSFTTQVHPNCGVYGPLTSVDAPAVTVSGNTWYDGPKKGQAVN